jgi:hypothetical protein
LGLVLSAADAPIGSAVATAELTFDDGNAQAFTVRLGESSLPHFNARLAWPGRKTPRSLRLRAVTDAPLTLRGVSSIDESDGTFLSQVVAADVRLVHSGDVKIYERVAPARRAVLRLDDGTTVGLEEAGGTITDDRPEFIRLALPAGSRARALILRDTCYPGWVAQADGVEVPITCEEVLFRAAELPAGTREVTFSYRPQWLVFGTALSAAGVAVWLLLIAAWRLWLASAHVWPASQAGRRCEQPSGHFFMRGSSASRRPSPRKVNEITNSETTAVTASKKPGWLPMIEYASRNRRPQLVMKKSLGFSEGRKPRPM